MHNYGRSVKRIKTNWKISLYSLECHLDNSNLKRIEMIAGSPLVERERIQVHPVEGAFGRPTKTSVASVTRSIIGDLSALYGSFTPRNLVLSTATRISPEVRITNGKIVRELLDRLLLEYDLVHCGGWIAPYTAAIVARRKATTADHSSRLVAHAILHPTMQGSGKTARLSRYFGPRLAVTAVEISKRFLIRHAMSSFDAITVSTPYERDLLQDLGLDNVHFVGEGIDLMAAKEMVKRARDISQRTETEIRAKHTVLFIGAKTKAKGYPDLLSCIRKLEREGLYVVLLAIGGKGGESQETNAMEEFLSSRKLFRSYDYVTEFEKYALIEASDVIVIPSAVETIPLVFLEAWAACKPVIGCSIPTVSSVMTNEGEGGILVPYGDHEALAKAIKRIVLDHNCAVDTGRKGYNLVATTYNLESVGQRLATIYEDLLEESR